MINYYVGWWIKFSSISLAWLSLVIQGIGYLSEPIMTIAVHLLSIVGKWNINEWPSSFIKIDKMQSKELIFISLILVNFVCLNSTATDESVSTDVSSSLVELIETCLFVLKKRSILSRLLGVDTKPKEKDTSNNSTKNSLINTMLSELYIGCTRKLCIMSFFSCLLLR